MCTDRSKTIAQVLREYGQCQRWDWSDFDGRSALAVMNMLADELTGQSELHDIAWHRRHLDMCPDGNGHWSGDLPDGGCDPGTCPTFAAEQAAMAGRASTL